MEKFIGQVKDKRLTQVFIQSTYSGILEGQVTAKFNQYILEKTLEFSKFIYPKANVVFLGDCNVKVLPSYTFIGEFSSVANCKNGADESYLAAIWFSDSPEVKLDFDDIPWDKAKWYYY